MRRYLVSFSLSLLLLLHSQASAQQPASASSSGGSFDAVARKLDSGGNFYMYMDLRGAISEMIESCNTIMATVAQQPQGNPEAAATLQRALKEFPERFGITGIEAVGMSGIKEGDLTRIKCYVAVPASDKGLRAMLGGTPRARPFNHFAPADTALYYDCDCSIATGYQMLHDAIIAVAPEAERAQFDAKIEQSEMRSGFPIRKVLQTLDGGVMFAFVLDPTRVDNLPTGGTKAFAIPHPTILLALQARDSSLYDAIKDKLTKSGIVPIMLPAGEGREVLQLPVLPLPIAMTLAIGHDAKCFYFTTDAQMLVDALKRMDEGKGGLADSPEYKKLTEGWPAESNAIAFSSDRMNGVMADVMRSAAAAQGQNPEVIKAVAKLYTKFGSAMIRTNESDGIMWVTRGHVTAPQMFLTAGAVPVGMLVAMAIPATMRNRGLAEQKACQSNLMKIDQAKQIWALERNKAPNDVPTWDDLVGPDKYLREIPTCPAGGTYSLNDVGHHPTCSYQNGRFSHSMTE